MEQTLYPIKILPYFLLYLFYICNKAQAVKADIAIPYSEMVENVVKEVFGKSTVNVTLYKNA